LLNYGFRFYETRLLYPAGGSVAEARVWKGDAERISIGLKNDLYVTIPRGSYEQIETKMDLPDQLIAPVDAEDQLGVVRVNLAEEILAERNLLALNTIYEGSIWERARDSVLMWFE
jgi:D-alanyl-D-alanine carboxypeptidase (penicillin-binding protein 5/6)